VHKSLAGRPLRVSDSAQSSSTITRRGWDAGVSAREIGRTLGAARSTIQDNLRRAQASGMAWPVVVQPQHVS
jgi:IS30 family transposase